jgi:Nif-specific regulatory protein
MNREPKLIGRSPPIQKLRQFINKAAKSNATVLLLGETGVGKEVAARLIHASSARKKSPFIKINCANLSDALIESELFGHKKGAFTGAVIDKPGLIEEANGGTFFFDEIADISPNLQAKFLSILEDKELRRLGENKTRRIDVRFILATNNDIEKLVQKGKFREDLYYRISVLFFHIAPLRKRKEDIPLLVHYYLKKMSLGFSQDFSTEREALAKLMRLEFPGNKISAKSKAAKGKNAKFSHEIIVKTVEKYQGNKTSAARALGLSRQWVHKVLKESNRNENDRLS